MLHKYIYSVMVEVVTVGRACTNAPGDNSNRILTLYLLYFDDLKGSQEQ